MNLVTITILLTPEAVVLLPLVLTWSEGLMAQIVKYIAKAEKGGKAPAGSRRGSAAFISCIWGQLISARAGGLPYNTHRRFYDPKNNHPAKKKKEMVSTIVVTTWVALEDHWAPTWGRRYGAWRTACFDAG